MIEGEGRGGGGGERTLSNSETPSRISVINPGNFSAHIKYSDNNFNNINALFTTQYPSPLIYNTMFTSTIVLFVFMMVVVVVVSGRFGVNIYYNNNNNYYYDCDDRGGREGGYERTIFG